jgi:hypothetical protein
VRARTFTVRLAALMGVGSLAVHQLRFALWYGKSSGDAPSSQGHAYLAVVGPVVVAVTLLAVARFLDRLARGHRGGVPPLTRLWAGVSASLLAMYSLQESLEGALAGGHPGGLAGVFGHGGWLAIPLAAVVGLALALALRGAGRAAEMLGRVRTPRPGLPSAPLTLGAPRFAVTRRELSLAPASARAPPATSA